MKPLKKALAVLLCLSIPALPYLASAEDSADSSQPAADLTAASIAHSITSTYGASSLQFALTDHGNLVAHGTSGVYSKSENRLLTDDNLYGIGSVSKVYTTAAALKLAEEGKLDIDHPVVEYLPEFTMADARYKDITVRMLMNHSSGLNGTCYNNAFLFGAYDSFAHDELLNHLSTQTLKADPGAFSVYCNDGFTLLELVIEKISGMTFTDYLHQTFLAPAKLENTKTPADDFDRTLLAKTYFPMFVQETPADSVGIIGTGGIYANASDLAAFGEILMGDRPELLSLASAQKMQSAEFKNGIWLDTNSGGSTYGLGWDSVSLPPFSDHGIKALTKGGDTLLYHAAVVVLPEYHLSAAVVSSGGSSAYNTLLAQKLLENALLEKGVLDAPFETILPQPVQKQDMPAEYEAYSGLYGATGNTIEIVLKNDSLIVDEGTEIEQVYPYTGDGTFSSEDGSLSLYFTTEENGLTYLVLSSVATLPGIGQIASEAYNAQRLERKELSEETIKAWEARNGKTYYVLNEKPASQLPILRSTSTLHVDSENGYASGNQIVDENTAKNVMQIPMANGRDTSDTVITQTEQGEIMTSGDMVLLSEDDILPIYDGGTAICTIQSNGYIRWYKVGENAKGKTISIDIPEGSTVLLYNSMGICTDSSIVTGNTKFELPENGKIAFAGKAGDVFHMDFLPDGLDAQE